MKKKVVEGPRRLDEVVHDHFSYVVEDEGFVVAVDRTGIYVFSDGVDEDSVDEYVEGLCSDLEIDRKDDLVLMPVKRDTDEAKAVDEGSLAVSVLDEVYRRSFVFSEAEVIEILGCFGYEASAGIPEPEEEEVDEDLDPDAITETRRFLAKSQFTIMLFPFLGFLLMYLDVVWWIPLIPYVIGITFASRFGLATKSYTALVIQVLCVFGMILSLVMFIVGDSSAILQCISKVQYFFTHINEFIVRW